MERIGARIKHKREDIAMQLNELAKKVGISSSALSQIENAKAFPSIITLKSIAENLNTTVGELIGENETENIPLVRRNEMQLIASNDFGADTYKLSYQILNKQMETYMLRFPEKSNSMGLFGKLTGQIFCYMVKGEIQFELDHQTYNLEEGDSVYFNARRNFRFLNVSKSTAEMVFVTSSKNL